MRPSTRWWRCALATALAASVCAQADGPTLTPLWNLTTDFAAPESAYYDAASNAVFVSSINGQILEKDGNGYISRLTPDGKIVSAKWVTGLNAPKGLRSVRGTLWVADIDEVVGVDIASGKDHLAREGRRRAVPQRPGHGARRHRLRVGFDALHASTRSRTARRRCSSKAATSSSSRTACWWTGRG